MSIEMEFFRTALLALASTDHDTTNKSYYGETNLYLLELLDLMIQELI